VFGAWLVEQDRINCRSARPPLTQAHRCLNPRVNSYELPEISARWPGSTAGWRADASRAQHGRSDEAARFDAGRKA